ncbi:MAG: nitrous oxide-stimulated promoter family protein [Candidatus Methanomethylophilaceae archaeon]|nr:nitrous oxide-stimulated promoter family protein [Candidatus Methanomethylophilaceae archaeon]
MGQSAEDFKGKRKEILLLTLNSYCKDIHNSDALCNQCQELLDYALVRLDRCPNNLTNIPCWRCPCVCYNEEMRLRMKDVMSHSRSYFRKHPVISFKYRFG